MFFGGCKRYIGRITCHREAVQQRGGGLRKVQADLVEDLAVKGPLEKEEEVCAMWLMSGLLCRVTVGLSLNQP